MNKLWVGLGLSVLLSLPLLAALKPGEKAPDFSAQGSLAGKEFSFSLENALKKGPVVVYFFPSAFTKGCDLEAHTFAEQKAKFDAAGATIIGVSADSIERLNAFSSDPQYCAGAFPVASDGDGKIAASYNLTKTAARPGMQDVRGVVVDHDLIERTTFVIGERPQDRRHAFLQGRRPFARCARREIAGHRAATPEIVAANSAG